MTLYQNSDEAESAWVDATLNRGCSCFLNPPCSFCEEGFCLDLEEFLSLQEYSDE